jgi:hypothetical protein
METIYTAYSKVVNDVNFYFVKKFTVFPEYENSPEILESFGMHRDFFRACDIAKIHDERVINKLMSDLKLIPESALVVPISGIKSVTHSLIKNTHGVISRFRLAGIN